MKGVHELREGGEKESSGPQRVIRRAEGPLSADGGSGGSHHFTFNQHPSSGGRKIDMRTKEGREMKRLMEQGQTQIEAPPPPPLKDSAATVSGFIPGDHIATPSKRRRVG